ncbi:hypothetical protein HBB16_08290 [Pseudonocardia sp. MCCB 268]|nr:hypothetical protein [Pseudonocardia cytotoxica]
MQRLDHIRKLLGSRWHEPDEFFPHPGGRSTYALRRAREPPADSGMTSARERRRPEIRHESSSGCSLRRPCNLSLDPRRIPKSALANPRNSVPRCSAARWATGHFSSPGRAHW